MSDTPYYGHAVEVIGAWVYSDPILTKRFNNYSGGRTVEQYFAQHAYEPLIISIALKDLQAPLSVYKQIEEY